MISIFAKPPFMMRHLQRVSSIVRGEQIAAYMGNARLNPESGYENDTCIYVKPHIKRGNDYKFDRTKSHILYGRGASAPLAVELAVSMGARPIICLGMDCDIGEDGRTNFYGDNPHHTIHTFKNCKKGLAAIAKLCPVDIINCSRSEILGELRDLEEVIQEVDPKGEFARGRQSYARQILRLEPPI